VGGMYAACIRHDALSQSHRPVWRTADPVDGYRPALEDRSCPDFI